MSIALGVCLSETEARRCEDRPGASCVESSSVWHRRSSSRGRRFLTSKEHHRGDHACTKADTALDDRIREAEVPLLARQYCTRLAPLVRTLSLSKSSLAVDLGAAIVVRESRTEKCVGQSYLRSPSTSNPAKHDLPDRAACSTQTVASHSALALPGGRLQPQMSVHNPNPVSIRLSLSHMASSWSRGGTTFTMHLPWWTLITYHT